MIERWVARAVSTSTASPRSARLFDCARRLSFRSCVCARRHYFRDRLLKSFDFTFPFWSVPTLRTCDAEPRLILCGCAGCCSIPNSTNTWEAIYEVPEMTPAEKEEILNSPFESRSDSFYFVDGKLIMHTKAEYAYAS